MTQYIFRFRNEKWHIEAEFNLCFDTDDEAKVVAKELHRHSEFAVLEVKNGPVLVLQIGQNYKQKTAL